MRLSIVTGVAGNPEITRRWIAKTGGHCTTRPEVVFSFNGCTEEERDSVLEWLPDAKYAWSDEPLGSSAALNRGIEMASGDVIITMHNDLMMQEDGWDERVCQFIENVPRAGFVGFAGGKGLGSAELGRAPYELHQLARNGVYSSLVDWPVHGAECVQPTTVAVLDGICIAARRQVWDMVDGFDERYIHHMYDIDICLNALRAGYTNFVLPIPCQHVSGQTANFPRYQEWLAKQGSSDAQVHQLSHRLFYEKWIGRGIPVRLP